MKIDIKPLFPVSYVKDSILELYEQIDGQKWPLEAKVQKLIYQYSNCVDPINEQLRSMMDDICGYYDISVKLKILHTLGDCVEL
jgi:hypothetical protein